MTTPNAPWPPPTTPPPGAAGWYQASDGHWYRSDEPPAPGYWLASDGRWYPPAIGLVDADAAWRRSRWGLGDAWWGLLVFLVASLAVGVAIGVALVADDSTLSFDEIEFGPYSIAVAVSANVVAFFGIPWLASRRKGLGSLARDFGLRLRPIDLAIGLGIGVGGLIAAGLTATGIDAAFGVDEATSNLPIDGLDGTGEIVAFLLAVGIVTPVIEELFFRGLIYRSLLKRGSSVSAAVVVTTIVFVVPHLTAVDGLANVVSLFGAIGVLGLTFNLACHWTGNRLGAPIVAHMVVNCAAVIGLAVG